jgi:hypothetical protein
MYYAAALEKYDGAPDADAKLMAQKLIDRMWFNYADAKGITATEKHGDYKRLNDSVPLPTSGWHGVMANGDVVQQGKTFLDIRSKYKNDPEYPRVAADLVAGKEPEFKFHRFWAQTEIALAQGDWAMLFPNDTVQTQNITVSVNNTKKSSLHSASPIVFKNGILQVSSGNMAFVFSMFSSNGKMVFSKAFSGATDIPMRSFPHGAYVAQVSNGKSIERNIILIGK